MEEKSGGSRIGACLALIALTFVAELACGIIYQILFLLFGLIGQLPEFLVWIIAFAFYPIVLSAIYYPAAKFLPWAAECAERICPTRKGLRYSCLVTVNLIFFAINASAWFILKSKFKITDLFPLLYAFIYWHIKVSLPETPVPSHGKKSSSEDNIRVAIAELKRLNPSDCWDIITKPVIESVHKDPDKVNIFFINNPSVSPMAWTISNLFTECGDQLSTGKYHFYRGELNRTGIELQSLYNFLGDELVKRQIASQDYVDNDKRIIRKNIREVG